MATCFAGTRLFSAERGRRFQTLRHAAEDLCEYLPFEIACRRRRGNGNTKLRNREIARA
jgi:hypothetical protein